ncbi:MAG: DegT/DnrJ/EryC1/StrS aminotransferase family protein [Candidatus Paceibacterota bacterium]
MRQSYLPFSPPLIGEEEIAEVVDALRSGWISSGPRTRQFEIDFGQLCEGRQALGLNSCTAGLHLALLGLGVGAGDEVITTPITFAATVNMIEMVGARPVLVDVEPDTLNIDPRRIEGAITSKTRAIMPVHFAGHPAEMDPINEIASERGLRVIEDAAHALPAKYKGRTIGAGPNPTAFSFYATKNITTGEGGMLVGDDQLVTEARITCLHGMSREAWNRYGKGGSWRYDIVRPGLKYNMFDIQAAIGMCQLKKLAQFQERRQAIVRAYFDALSDEPGVKLPAHRDHVEHAWHLFVIRVQEEFVGGGRDQFLEELTKRNIGTSVHFIPIHMHSYYQNKYRYRHGDFPIAEQNFAQMLSLPLNPAMTDTDVEDVVDAVKQVLRNLKPARRAA